MIRSHVLICGGTGCTSSKSVKVKDAMEAAIAANGLAEEVKVKVGDGEKDAAKLYKCRDIKVLKTAKGSDVLREFEPLTIRIF